MKRLRMRGWEWTLALTMAAVAGVPARGQEPSPTKSQAPAANYEKPAAYRLGDEERKALGEKTAELERAIAGLPRAEPSQREALTDVAIFAKAGAYALRFAEFYTAKDVAMTRGVLERGLERARALADGRRPWADARGSVVRAYESRVDGSLQPYAVIVPEGLDPSADRVRLDVVLHGRGATLNEARFISSHDGKPAPADAAGKITLHVFGRTNNAYRWSGEADVFEAIDAVKRNYKVDDRRIVLRGFSMGGAGAWHLGLHHPSVWSSVEAGAGFTESKKYARLKEIPDVHEKALHIYDAVDYAGNAFNVPMAGYGGEEDPQLQGALNIEEALKALGYGMTTEGLVTKGTDIDFLRVVGARMGHKVDPASAKILAAFHDDRAVKGLDRDPKRIRFTTYTLKYNQAPWLRVEAMKEHYRRAYVDAEIKDGAVVVHEAENVAVLSVFREMGATIRLGGKEFPLESAARGLLPDVYFRRVGDGDAWEPLDYDASRAFEKNADRGKRHKLQGPIDDAFSTGFVCVVGDAPGEAWDPEVGRWAGRRLEAFVDDWRRYLRGEVPVKKEGELTPEDIETRHLVLFGDPGSNRLLARLLKDLPLSWTRDEIRLGGRVFGSRGRVPVLIAPNPLNPHRYVVLNTGHTFGAREFRGTNALLYPRLGDYALFSADTDADGPIDSGYFDEAWKGR